MALGTPIRYSPMATANAKNDIDEKLHREVSADARGGVFQHLRGHGHLTSVPPGG